MQESNGNTEVLYQVVAIVAVVVAATTYLFFSRRVEMSLLDCSNLAAQ